MHWLGLRLQFISFEGEIVEPAPDPVVDADVDVDEVTLMHLLHKLYTRFYKN